MSKETVVHFNYDSNPEQRIASIFYPFMSTLSLSVCISVSVSKSLLLSMCVCVCRPISVSLTHSRLKQLLNMYYIKVNAKYMHVRVCIALPVLLLQRRFSISYHVRNFYILSFLSIKLVDLNQSVLHGQADILSWSRTGLSKGQ